MYERALEFFGDELDDEKLFVAFAKFEVRCGEVRACFSPLRPCKRWRSGLLTEGWWYVCANAA